MYLQGKDNIYDLDWNSDSSFALSYGDVFHQNEVEQSSYNFEYADTDNLFAEFDAAEQECNRLLEHGLALPAYEQILKASHLFNLLDARQVISVTERQQYILRIRSLARLVANAYLQSRQDLDFPLLKSTDR